MERKVGVPDRNILHNHVANTKRRKKNNFQTRTGPEFYISDTKYEYNLATICSIYQLLLCVYYSTGSSFPKSISKMAQN